ncbi:hypothetical protein [Aliarcobacter butzleri]|uniref:hypothetical protein n=1 Tax=Aliarcobacter butzleri TaxID=28197 RepID=UPI003B20CAFE
MNKFIIKKALGLIVVGITLASLSVNFYVVDVKVIFNVNIFNVSIKKGKDLPFLL